MRDVTHPRRRDRSLRTGSWDVVPGAEDDGPGQHVDRLATMGTADRVTGGAKGA